MDQGAQDTKVADSMVLDHREKREGLESANLSTPISGAGESRPAPAEPETPISNNDPKFKYKYAEASPTPDNVDDVEWNKIYTAADSRMYNKHNKNASNSKKFRISGETRTLALQMLKEKMEKKALDLAGGPASTPKPAPKPKVPAAKKTPTIKKESTASSRDATPGGEMMNLSISEKIKSEGRARKASSTGPPSSQGTPAPSTIAKNNSPAPPMVKPPLKKKGTAAPVKKRAKKPKNQGKTALNSNRASQTPGPSADADSGSESNDGGEYCICRGPDDHRMMVNCEGGCGEWYHCSCINIPEDDASELLDRYICKNCTTETKYTTWKPMCRYNNVGKFLVEEGHTHIKPCRKAARVTLDKPSKYCSDEHKEAFWEFVATLARQDDEPSMGGALNVGEIGEILASVKTVEEFHALGQKPKLPRPEGYDPNRAIGLDYVTEVEQQELDDIDEKKTEIEEEIMLYGHQKKLLEMIHLRAKMAGDLVAKQPALADGVKDICGYDNRLSFNHVQFRMWLDSAEGKKAFDKNAIGPRTEETMHINRVIPAPGEVPTEAPAAPHFLQNICLKNRKRCKHASWREIHNQDYVDMPIIKRAELKKLELRAAEIIDDAETREAMKLYYADNIRLCLLEDN